MCQPPKEAEGTENQSDRQPADDAESILHGMTGGAVGWPNIGVWLRHREHHSEEGLIVVFERVISKRGGLDSGSDQQRRDLVVFECEVATKLNGASWEVAADVGRDDDLRAVQVMAVTSVTGFVSAIARSIHAAISAPQ